jgi:N-acetylated-alpha-linked acidic dipeptidase
VAALQEANDLVARLERRFLLAEGLPGRKWFKSLLHAPSLESGYGVTVLPEIREATQRGDADGRVKGVQHLSTAIEAAVSDLKAAAQKITGAPPPAPSQPAENKGG